MKVMSGMGMGLTENDGRLSAYGLEFEPEPLHVGQRVEGEADWLEEMPRLVGEEGGTRLSRCRVQDCCRATQVDANLNRILCAMSCDTHVSCTHNIPSKYEKKSAKSLPQAHPCT